MGTNAELLRALYPSPKGDYRVRTLPTESLAKTSSNRLDFRNCRFSALTRVLIEDADFSNSSSMERGTGITISSSVIRRSLFDSSGPFSRLGGSFENCNFIKIRAKKSHVTGLFVSCTFESTDFSGAMFVGNFEDCTFSNCSLNVDAFTAGFKDCTFVDCTLPSWLGEDASTLPAQRKTTFSVKSGKVYFNEYTKFHNEPSIV
ncbi:MAG: hypothetical protein ACOY9I_11175 [Pseudomonadota bacterium]